jgi:predicted O-methyltransferase YrrM
MEPSAAWTDVDRFLSSRLAELDPDLEAARVTNQSAGLPAIDVSEVQGRLLQWLMGLVGARRVLEVGTLGGFSTLWMAKALPEDGEIVTLEIDARHADVARANFERAGCAHQVDLRLGPALSALDALRAESPQRFDFAFIDADKQNNASYLARVASLVRIGGLIVVDNVVRNGRILTTEAEDPSVLGTLEAIDVARSDDRLDPCALQTVGAKGWDGMLLARVVRD